MGVIAGKYEAKLEGFGPGSSSLHLPMTPHGPESNVFETKSTEKLEPKRIPDTDCAFMFETHMMLRTTKQVNNNLMKIDPNYNDVWQGLKDNFDPNAK